MGNKPSANAQEVANEFIMKQKIEDIKKLKDPEVCREYIEFAEERLYTILTRAQVYEMIKHIKMTVPDVDADTDDIRIAKERRVLCGHIAKYYTQIGHLISVILEALEPSFNIGDHVVNYLDLYNVPDGEIKPISYNFCSHRLHAILPVESGKNVKLIPMFCHTEFQPIRPVEFQPVQPVQPIYKPEPIQQEPIQPEPIQPESTKQEPIYKPTDTKQEPIQPEPIQPEPIQQEPIYKPTDTKQEPIYETEFSPLEKELTEIINDINTMERYTAQNDAKYKSIYEYSYKPLQFGGILKALFNTTQTGGGKDVNKFPDFDELYYDVYNPDTDEFDKMSPENRQQYNNDAAIMYFIITGQKPIEPVSFKSLPTLATNDMYEKCTSEDYKRQIELEIEDPIYKELANKRIDLLMALKFHSIKLKNIMSSLATGQPSINPDLTFDELKDLTRQTREVIMDMTAKCELYYKDIRNIWDALIHRRKQSQIDEQRDNLQNAMF
jgi:hypothetical protein